MTVQHPIELLDPKTLVPYPGNAKKHPEDQIEKLVKSIRKFNWTSPIIVDRDLVIIAGHGRTLAALKMGLDKVPVIVRRDLTKDEADALRLADNRVASNDYDMDLIQTELMRLNDLDFDMDTMGFDDKELDFSLSDLGDIDESLFVSDIGAAVEEQKEANSKTIEATDDVAAPVGDALGFKRVTVAQSRELRDLMGKVEAEFKLKGVEALIRALSHAL